LTITPLEIPEILLLQHTIHSDERGWFVELWNPRGSGHPGLPTLFAQDNMVYSRKGVLRGLHFQQPHAQGKLITTAQGEIFDVAVDIRPQSRTFGCWTSSVLKPGSALYIPPGFAHGYQVLSSAALVVYKCTESYHPESEHTLAWDDAALAITWPIASPVLSEKDRRGQALSELRELLPRYAAL
jgi:dTDP-4-dehydrorhamnose 3,5-epimerase